MQRYLKVYGVTVLVSILCIFFPWLLEILGATNGIDVLEWQGILAGIVGLVLSAVYVLRKVKKWKPRLVILLLNPAIYYIIVLVYIGISIASEPWHGFNLTP